MVNCELYPGDRRTQSSAETQQKHACGGFDFNLGSQPWTDDEATADELNRMPSNGRSDLSELCHMGQPCGPPGWQGPAVSAGTPDMGLLRRLATAMPTTPRPSKRGVCFSRGGTPLLSPVPVAALDSCPIDDDRCVTPPARIPLIPPMPPAPRRPFSARSLGSPPPVPLRAAAALPAEEEAAPTAAAFPARPPAPPSTPSRPEFVAIPIPDAFAYITIPGAGHVPCLLLPAGGAAACPPAGSPVAVAAPLQREQVLGTLCCNYLRTAKRRRTIAADLDDEADSRGSSN